MLDHLHSLVKCSLAGTGLLCEQWNSTLRIRHSQFAYTIDGSILWSAGVSRGGAERLFLFRFTDSLENGTGKHFFFPSIFSVSVCCLEAAGITQARQSVSFHWQRPKRGKHRNYCLLWSYHSKPLLHKHFLQRERKNKEYNNVTWTMMTIVVTHIIQEVSTDCWSACDCVDYSFALFADTLPCL